MINLTGENKATLIYMAANNTESFNYNKALEEAVEFQEVILKLQTKQVDKKPDKVEAFKEYGDLIYRGLVAIMTIYPNMTIDGILEIVKNHIDYKLDKLRDFADSEEYQGYL